MKITVDSKNYYIDVDSVKSVFIREHAFSSGMNYEVDISFGTFGTIIPCKSKELAERLADNIGDHIADKEASDTAFDINKKEYIDGFKDGLEYAIRIQKDNK